MVCSSYTNKNKGQNCSVYIQTEKIDPQSRKAFLASGPYDGGGEECLDLRMWSRDENVGQSDTGQASMPVDEL